MLNSSGELEACTVCPQIAVGSNGVFAAGHTQPCLVWPHIAQSETQEQKNGNNQFGRTRAPERGTDSGSQWVGASEESSGRLSQLACVDQWHVLAEDPIVLRWWHCFSLVADIILIGIVYGWAWYAAGASWRIVPPILYVLAGTVFIIDVLVHGPSSKVSRIGPLLGATQLYFSTYPLFQPPSKVCEPRICDAGLHFNSDGAIVCFNPHLG